MLSSAATDKVRTTSLLIVSEEERGEERHVFGPVNNARIDGNKRNRR